MALPIIKVNSGSGSDSGASGAGPGDGTTGGSALTGTNASFSGATVTLDGSPDLSGVATDGSHVLYLVTSTGVRFFKITAKGSGTVDVTPSPAGTATGRTWAIGGKRASLTSAASLVLVDNGGAAGDAMPGWVIEFESGHTETAGAELRMRRAGDTTSGPIVLRGAAGAATLPLLTFSHNGNGLLLAAVFQQARDFELRNSNATKTASVAVAVTPSDSGAQVERLKVSHATDSFWKGIITGTSGSCVQVSRCEVGHTASDGIEFSNTGSNLGGFRVEGCHVHDCGGRGIEFPAGPWFGVVVEHNLVEGNASDGIYYDNIRADTLGGAHFAHNTIDGNGGDGLEVANAANSVRGTVVENNLFTSNGGYGLNFSSGSHTAAFLQASGVAVRNNLFNGNTSGPYNPSGLDSRDEQTTDPDYVNAAAGDFTPQEAALEGTAFPTSIP